MLRSFSFDAGRLRVCAEPEIGAGAVWFDLLHPTVDEEARVESYLGIEVPTREEMQEIEISSRLYQEDGASFMTATLLAQADSDAPELAPVTFVLTDRCLVTIRYHEPRVFSAFSSRSEKQSLGGETSAVVLLGLLEAAVDRLADVIERTAKDINALSSETFRPHPHGHGQDFQLALRTIGLKGDLVSSVRESLVSLSRLTGFFVHQHASHEAEITPRLKTLGRDIQSLTDHATFVSQKINFLLDATLGMINIEQNAIIKIFSVAAVIFLPPTLVASMYGMNFEFMPELGWRLGYPFAIGLMILSGLIPYWYFKRRRWL